MQRCLNHWTIRVGTWLLAASMLAACAGLPVQEPHRPVARAIPRDVRTPLGGLAEASIRALRMQPGQTDPVPTTGAMPDGSRPGLSGFRLLPLGSHALEARLQLVRRAQASLDLQVYHFAADASGLALLRALRDASGRGVRVRVLIDDLYTGGADRLWQTFDGLPGVQVRLFNPFTSARCCGPVARFAAAPLSWGRINHRMHNKLFIADGAWTIFGGRNVADVYFLKRETDNFIDLDVLAAGAIVPPMQEEFDRYWNAGTAYPVQAIVSGGRGRLAVDLADRTAQVEQLSGPAVELDVDAMPLPASDVLGQPPLGELLGQGAIPLVAGRARVLADHPEKPLRGAPGGELMTSSVTHGVYQAMQLAQHEILASSPYFVPGRQGLDLLVALRGRGVEIRILTNSLASTDEPWVHLAYARYREALLAKGIQLFELSQHRVRGNVRMFLFGASLGRLHAKSVVIDERWAFVGSMNLDPRSATLNTEFGALIDSPELARQVKALIEIDRLHSAYALRLAADGSCCEWVIPDGDGRQVLTLEPDSRWWMRWLGSLLQPLAPEDHL